MKEESIYIPISKVDSLYMKRFYVDDQGIPVLMLHGSIENGRIFYSKTQKGFAPYLARHGYDVFVADMQGRGNSKPPMNRRSTYGQTDVIKTDIRACYEKIVEIKGVVPQHWVAHSWGGVLMLSHLARYQANVQSLVFFATKRRITYRGWKWYTDILFKWHIMGRFLIQLYGYLPAKRLGFGSDNEPRNHFYEINEWLYKKAKWKDNKDGYDYRKAIQAKKLPPTLYMTGKKDILLSNPKDVQLLINETGDQQTESWLLSKHNGNLHDYGHNDILAHKDAPKDHFPKILQWLKKTEQSI